MGIFRQFPYSNFHDMNLDWILLRVKELWKGVFELDKRIDDFIIETEPAIRDEVDKWLDDHPEATTTVEDGAITLPKFSDELKNDFLELETSPNLLSYNQRKFYDAPTILGEYYESETKFARLQSTCFNKLNNHYLFVFAPDTGQTTNVIVETDMNLTVIKRKALNLVKGNDATYNPRTDKYYIVAGSGDPRIFVIDPYTLSIENEIVIADFADGFGQIAYNEKNDIYILTEYATNRVYKSDSSFTQLNYLFTELKDDHITYEYDNIVSSDFQTAESIDDIFINIYWIYSNGINSYARAIFYNLYTNEKTCEIDIPIGRYEEPEGVCFNGYALLLTGYDRNYITTANIYINKVVEDLDNNAWLDVTKYFTALKGVKNFEAKLNRITGEIWASGAINNAELVAGDNQIVQITLQPLKPFDYYVVANALISSNVVPCIINARTYLNVTVPSTLVGTRNIIFTFNYYCQGVLP